MSSQIDTIMQQASASLVGMDYLACESLCLEALQLARQQRNWAYYARILLPLQEARRQRRMIAAEGLVRLGTGSLAGDPADWIKPLTAGCLVVTSPNGAAAAQQIEDLARHQRKYIEVLLADPADDPPAGDGQTWTIRSFRGPQVQCQVPAPPVHWVDCWLPVDPSAATSDAAWPALPVVDSQTPADWFINATEKLGDAALAQVRRPVGDLARVDELEQCLQVVVDHEILHQRLADAARAAAVDS